MTTTLRPVDELPARRDHIEVHLHNWSYRCPCGGTGWRSIAPGPDQLTTTCAYEAHATSTQRGIPCGRTVTWQQDADRVERGIAHPARGASGGPVVRLGNGRDDGPIPWLADRVTGWRLVGEA